MHPKLFRFCCLILICATAFIVPFTVPASADSTVVSDVIDAITQSVITNIPNHNGYDIDVNYIDISEDWAFARIQINTNAIQQGGTPEMILVLVRKSGNTWKVQLEDEPDFFPWLFNAPDDLISEEVKEFYQSVTASGIGEAQLSLPFPVGERWYLTGGPHNGTYFCGLVNGYPSEACREPNGRPWASLDFQGRLDSENVVAARGGIAYTANCEVRIVHENNGWETRYFHLASIPDNINGVRVERGAFLGIAAGVCGDSTGRHVDFGLRYNGNSVNIHNHDIGGWTVSDGTHQYYGCLTRISDGLQRCAFSGNFTIANDGTIGNGSGDGGSISGPAPKWDFAARSNLGWSERYNLSPDNPYVNASNPGNYFDGGMWMEVTAPDPQVRSPITSFNASDYPIFHILMSSAADSCGEVFFQRTTDNDFFASNQLPIPIVRNTEQSYIVDMRNNSNWNGTIRRLRVDPACTYRANQTDAVRINLIRFATPDTSWDFAEENNQGWSERVRMSAENPSNFFDGGMWMAVQGEDPYIYGPQVAFKASNYRYMLIEMASTTDTCGQIYFTKDQEGFTSSKAIGFTVNPDGHDRTYVIDMKSNNNYNGVITQLRLDPACAPRAGAGNAVRINRIVMSNVAPPTNGDINNDGRITSRDAIYVINRLGTSEISADVNADGFVTQDDVDAVYDKIGQSAN